MPDSESGAGVELEDLLAREAIRELAHRYAVAVDGKDVDAIAELFAVDVDNGRWGPGRDGVRRFYDSALRQFDGTVHLVGTHVIDFDGPDLAHGIAYTLAQHRMVGLDAWFDVATTYWDRYCSRDGRWYFVSRRTRWLYRQELRRGNPDTLERRQPSAGSRGSDPESQLPDAWPHYHDFWARDPLGPTR